jgi:hypothetical protein
MLQLLSNFFLFTYLAFYIPVYGRVRSRVLDSHLIQFTMLICISVTETDQAVEKMLQSQLLERFPDYR